MQIVRHLKLKPSHMVPSLSLRFAIPLPLTSGRQRRLDTEGPESALLQILRLPSIVGWQSNFDDNDKCATYSISSNMR